jgi:serine/threonine protein phosphatase PrpC
MRGSCWTLLLLCNAGPRGPLIAEPEVCVHELEANDEFMLLGCDGLWDVFPSQRAVEFARGRLREHNNPQRCAEELVAGASSGGGGLMCEGCVRDV